MLEDPNKFVQNFVLESDEACAQKWLSDAAMWTRHGVYDRVVQALDLQRGATHLDMGCGLGHLLGSLHLQQPNSTLLGVDRNPYMLMGASQLLNDNRIRTLACISAGIGFEEGYIKRRYEFHSDMAKYKPGKVGEVTLISDDFRQIGLFNRLFSDREITSASFVMPGTSAIGIQEFPYVPQEVGTAEEKRRTNELMADTRRSAFEYVARRLKIGGYFVVAERIGYVWGDIGVVVDRLRSVMGSAGDCFDFDATGTFLSDISGIYISGSDTMWTSTRTQIPLIVEDTK